MGQEAKKTDVNKITEVWNGFARKYGVDRRTSTPDAYLVDLEIKTLTKYINDGGILLDIGCGNGYTSVKLASKKRVEIVGIDISPELIKYANQLVKHEEKKLKGTFKFRIGNILDPDFLTSFGKSNYDMVLTKRTLINILSWEEQKDTILKIWQLLKPFGTYIMIEATVQGYEKINNLRERFKIPRTPIRWHNNYLDEEKLIPFLKEKFDITRVSNFSSTYYVGSRFVQPLLLKPLGKEPHYNFCLNRLFASLPSFGNYGMQKLFICKKRE